MPAVLLTVLSSWPPVIFTGVLNLVTEMETTMDNLFILNSTAALIDIKAGIDERFSKAQSVLTCLMSIMEFLHKNPHIDSMVIYHSLWAVNDLLDEIACLNDFLKKKQIH